MGYKIDILNGATKDGNKSIKELKINTHQKEIEKLNLEIQNKRHLLTNLETKISRQLKLSLSEEKPPERKFLGSRDIVTLDYDEYLQDRKKFEKVKKKFTNLSKVNDNLKIDNAELFDKVKDVIKENEYLKNQPYSLNINYLRKKNNELEQTLEKKEIEIIGFKEEIEEKKYDMQTSNIKLFQMSIADANSREDKRDYYKKFLKDLMEKAEYPNQKSRTLINFIIDNKNTLHKKDYLNMLKSAKELLSDRQFIPIGFHNIVSKVITEAMRFAEKSLNINRNDRELSL